MKTYYLDADYRLHLSYAEGLKPWEDAEGRFDGKCQAYIEGFRVVPESETWVREDGAEFTGLMISAAVPFDELDAAQREHERKLLAEYETALSAIETALGV